MPDGVMIVDINDCIRFVNRRFCEMTGYSGEELLGKTAHKMLFSEKKQPIILDKLNMRKKGIADRYEITMRCKSEKELWVHISGSPIYNVQGRDVRIVWHRNGYHHAKTRGSVAVGERKAVSIAIQQRQRCCFCLLSRRKQDAR